MVVKGIVDEGFVNYKTPAMEIITSYCSFKCDKECGVQVCQNGALATAPSKDISTHSIIKKYLNNPITNAICFVGLEPLDQFDEVIHFIYTLRNLYHCDDTVVIYTGYNKNEIEDKINYLKWFKNIIVKFGRYVPNDENRFDDILGVNLASQNQYAEVIS